VCRDNDKTRNFYNIHFFERNEKAERQERLLATVFIQIGDKSSKAPQFILMATTNEENPTDFVFLATERRQRKYYKQLRLYLAEKLVSV